MNDFNVPFCVKERRWFQQRNNGKILVNEGSNITVISLFILREKMKYLFILMILLFLLFKKKGLKVLKKIRAAFSEKSIPNELKGDVMDSSDTDEISSSIPNNIRKDIINRQYLRMVQTKQPINTLTDHSADNDKKRFEETDTINLNSDSILIDTDGEIHSMYDLSSANVDQSHYSSSKYSFKEKQKFESLKNSSPDDLVQRVRYRLKEVKENQKINR